MSSNGDDQHPYYTFFPDLGLVITAAHLESISKRLRPHFGIQSSRSGVSSIKTDSFEKYEGEDKCWTIYYISLRFRALATNKDLPRGQKRSCFLQCISIKKATCSTFTAHQAQTPTVTPDLNPYC